MLPNVVLSNQDFKVVGKRPIRHDGYDKVTGKARYGADIHPPGLLYGKVLRSPYAHARILSVDTDKATAHPEFRAIVTVADFPDPNGGEPIQSSHASNNILARDKVVYKGHPILAIAATSLHVAEEVLSLVEVKYEVLPAVTDVEEAMKPGAPQIHDDLNGNIDSHSTLKQGDIKQGFMDADLVIEREYRTDTVHQGYIEPHSVTVSWGANDQLTLWTSSQGHFQIRDSTAATLGIPASHIKSVPMEIGGGFGGKTKIYVEPVAAILSKIAGHPVKITMTRAEVLEATGPTSASYTKLKVGARKDGKITAVEATLAYESGAFPGSSVGAGALCMLAPYDVGVFHVDGYSVVDNKPSVAAYRAPGSPAASFAFESMVDEICREISMDPLEFRILNGAKEGTRRANGMLNPRIGCLETTEAARDHDHYSTPLEGPNRGRGVATGFWMNGGGAACAIANVNYDGTVNLIIGSMDIGGTRPAAAQQFAEVLGISAEDVNPQVGDTESIGYTSMTGGSGAAFKTGWACYEAGQDVKRQMIGRAATIWEASPDDVELVDGVFQHRTTPEKKITFKELAGALAGSGGPVVGSANLNPAGAGSAFATNIVDLEVDPETGKITILRYTAFQDAGKAVHPSYVEGQMQGGVVQGIGWAINEEYFMGEDGQMMNSSLLDYRMPTSLDLPMIDTAIIEVANPGHPYGVRGVAEVPIVAPLAAIANAVYDAIGVRMTKLPMNPASVLKALSGNGVGST